IKGYIKESPKDDPRIPRHFCKTCRRYWTKGGALRNVPIGGGCRKNKTTIVSSSVVSGKSAASGGGGVANSTGKMKMVMSSSEINNIGRSGFGGGGLFDLHDHHQLSSNSPILWGSPQNSHLLALLSQNPHYQQINGLISSASLPHHNNNDNNNNGIQEMYQRLRSSSSTTTSSSPANNNNNYYNDHHSS
ncbi:hypothetical protein F8388_017097, partial [Cannabis sativa]